MRAAQASGGFSARGPRSHRHTRRLRAWRVRGLHHPLQRRGGALLHHAGGSSRWRRDCTPSRALPPRTSDFPATARHSTKITDCNAASVRPACSWWHSISCVSIRGAAEPRRKFARRSRRCCADAPAIATFPLDPPAAAEAMRRDRGEGRKRAFFKFRFSLQESRSLRQSTMLRREDRRLLLGHGQYVGDLVLPRMLHAVFVRSPMAHARIRSVDLTRAAAAPGVVYVLSGIELAQLLADGAKTSRCRCRANGFRNTVKHQIPQSATGLACRRQGAACRRGFRGYRGGEPLCRRGCCPGHSSRRISSRCPRRSIPKQALQGRERRSCMSSFGTNLIAELRRRQGRCRKRPDAQAPRRLERRFHHHRYGAIPMECRGVVGTLRRTRRCGDDLVILPGRALAAARGLHGAQHARGAHSLRRARRRRRFWRQRPRLSRGIAHSVPCARR